MNKDKAIGAVVLVVSVAGILVYAWLLLNFPMVVLQITAFIAVALLLVITAWIGWTMVTTPPTSSLEPVPNATVSQGNAEERQ